LGKQTKISKVLFKQKLGKKDITFGGWPGEAIHCLFIYACPVIVLPESFISLSCNANMKGEKLLSANCFKLDGKVSSRENGLGIK